MIKFILSTLIVIFIKNLIYSVKLKKLSPKSLIFDIAYYNIILSVTLLIYFLGLEKILLPSSFIDLINFTLIYIFSKCLLEFLFIFTFSNASYAFLPFIHNAKEFIENYNLFKNIKISMYFIPYIVLIFLLNNLNSLESLFYAFTIIFFTTICQFFKLKKSILDMGLLSKKTEN